MNWERSFLDLFDCRSIETINFGVQHMDVKVDGIAAFSMGGKYVLRDLSWHKRKHICNHKRVIELHKYGTNPHHSIVNHHAIPISFSCMIHWI